MFPVVSPEGEGASTRGQTLIRLLRDGPISYGQLVRLAQDAGISRATTSRYLAELKEAGVVLDLGASGYGLAPGFTPPSWGVMEIAYCEWFDAIQPDGSSFVQIGSRFRLLWGELQSLPLRLFPLKTPSRSDIHCRGSRSPYVRRVATDRDFPGCQIVDIAFGDPDPGVGHPQELFVDYVAGIPSHRMYRHQYLGEFFEQHDPDDGWESARLTVLGQAFPGMRRVLAPQAALRIQVVLPKSFPARSVNGVSWPYPSSEPDRKAGTRPGTDPSGLTRRKNVLTWTITRPQLDRVYTLRWLPPRRPDYVRWFRTISAGGARSAKA